MNYMSLITYEMIHTSFPREGIFPWHLVLIFFLCRHQVDTEGQSGNSVLLKEMQ